jgi:septum formation protein
MDPSPAPSSASAARAPVGAHAPRLVLASSSPRRADLLARLGLAPVIHPAAIDETPRDGEDPATLVLRLARSKAARVVEVRDDGDELVLAADTVVVHDGRTLGQPRDRDEAAAMLHALSGTTHEVVTGVAARRGTQHVHRRVTTRVAFRTLDEARIRWYLATGEADDKAGSYALQGAGAVLVAGIEGSDTNVIGLPLAETVELLAELGLDVCAPPTDGL